MVDRLLSMAGGEGLMNDDGTKKIQCRFLSWVAVCYPLPLPALGKRRQRTARGRAGAGRELRRSLGGHIEGVVGCEDVEPCMVDMLVGGLDEGVLRRCRPGAVFM